MAGENQFYRLKFNRALEPIKVMMVKRKLDLSLNEWISFVERTKMSIIAHPQEYLGDELPAKDGLVELIENIFKDFLKEQATKRINLIQK
ncbi:hypothetical protein BH10BAC4_BH10BAC4_23310 [soil metagenome]